MHQDPALHARGSACIPAPEGRIYRVALLSTATSPDPDPGMPLSLRFPFGAALSDGDRGRDAAARAGTVRLDAPIGTYLTGYPNADVVANVTRSLQFGPGAQYVYSNSGSLRLGAVIERVGGRSYPAHVAERVLVPAGMTTPARSPRPY